MDFSAIVVLVLLFAIGYELLHPGHAAPHTHTEAVELWHPPAPPPVPLTWQNNSMFVAADTVIRHHRSVRDAQTRAAQTMSSTSAALLG